MKKKLKAFTLVELIVVITILVILGTIAFISLQGYSKNARNSVRIADLSSIDKQLEIYYLKAGSLPIPDDYITLYASGNIIGYQGFAGKRVLDLIGVFNGGKDPLDEEYYTYMTDINRKNYQLMGFLEDSIVFNITNNSYADNSKRTPIVKGKELGIIVNLNNDPIQKIITTNFDIATTNDIYKAYLDNENIITGTGTELKKASPTYSCDRILQLMRNKKSGDYNIDNYYFTGTTDLNVNCDIDLDGLTPIVKSIGGEGNDIINDIKTDSAGNIYILGYFNSPSINIFGQTITTNGGYDYFIAKLDSNFNLIWLKNGGGTGTEQITSIQLDSAGNIYIGGFLNSLSANIFGQTISTVGGYDYFVAKLDNNGNTIWLKNGGGTGTEYVNKIQLGSAGNIYIGGYFNSTNANIFGQTISTAGTRDYYLAKLDTNGNTIWLKNGGGTGADIINQIEIDITGNIYIGGYFSSTNVNIFGQTISTAGGQDYFVTKLDTNGNTIWLKYGGGIGDEFINSIQINSTGYIYILGYFNSTNANIFGQNISTNGGIDYYLAKLDNNGNLIWLKNGGGTGIDNINGIQFDTNGNVYIGGRFDSTNANIFGQTISTVGGQDYLIAKLDTNGNLIWLKNGGGTGDEFTKVLNIDLIGNIYIGVRSNSTNANIFGQTISTNGGNDIFLVKLFK